jgi:diguanylate cyclase (GGDEF)-like protein
MSDVRLIIVTFLLLSTILALTLAVTALRRFSSIGISSMYFAFCMAAAALHSFGYAMEILSNSLPDVLFWTKIEYPGIQFIIPAWLLFALSVTGRDKFITWGRVAALFAFPLLTVLANWTNEAHHLLYSSTSLSTDGPFPTLVVERGPIYRIGIVYVSICLLISTLIFTIMLVKSAPSFRRHAIIFFVAGLVPWVGMGLYLSGNTPYNLDFSAIFATISGLICAYGFLRVQLLDVVPLARDRIFEGMSDGMLVLDRNDRIVDFNPAFPTVLSKVNRASIGASVFKVLDGYPAIIDQIRANSQEIVELSIQTQQEPAYFQSSISPVLDRRRKVIGKIVSLHNYTHMRQLIDQMRELAILDGLTGMFNRRHFNELAGHEIYRAQRYGCNLALIMIDLDHFKLVNDTYGHAAGDFVLKNVADICRQNIRQTDILGRFGGEEFMILMPETDLTAASATAERLRAVIAQTPTLYEGFTIMVTASFGVTSPAASRAASFDTLLRQADTAVYEAKKNGRNRVCMHKPI